LILVGVDSVGTCTEAILHFGKTQQMYNFLSGSPEIKNFEESWKFSLYIISTTRWSAKIEAVKSVANHSFGITAAIDDAELLNLQPNACRDLHSIIQYLVTFECVLL